MNIDHLSERKKQEFGRQVRDLRANYKNRQRKARNLINPIKNPRYDDVCFEGIAWLDSLAGEPFSEDIWKSPALKGQDIP